MKRRSRDSRVTNESIDFAAAQNRSGRSAETDHGKAGGPRPEIFSTARQAVLHPNTGTHRLQLSAASVPRVTRPRPLQLHETPTETKEHIQLTLRYWYIVLVLSAWSLATHCTCNATTCASKKQRIAGITGNLLSLMIFVAGITGNTV